MDSINAERKGPLDISRLARLSDVVYGLILFRLFLLLPRPEDKDWHWSTISGFVGDNLGTFLLILLTTIIIIIYWVQNNSLLQKLDFTDGIHTSLLILQLFFVLLFLYSIRMGIEFGASPGTRVMESVIVALIGILGAVAWVYAARGRRFLKNEVSDDTAEQLFIRNLSEPLTALFTICFAWLGWLAWELSWFIYPLFAFLLNRYALLRIRKHMSGRPFEL
jgi:uncharacterized membrane protein